MKKVLLALLLIAETIFSAEAYDFSAVAPSGQTLYYNIVDGNAEVTSENSSYPRYSVDLIGNLTIPSTVPYNGETYVVTSIGDYAFYSCLRLTSINIPSSITSIGTYAFYNCDGLTSITIPESVNYINTYAFTNCSNMTTVNYNAIACTMEPVTTGYSASPVFGSCPITTLNIGQNVQVIPARAFYYSRNIVSLSIPGSVTSIGSNAFNGCSGLTSINISTDNSVYDSRGNCNAVIETATNKLVTGCSTTIIPNTINTIGSYAFLACINLSAITIPNSVSVIESGAFDGCRGLTGTFTIPNSVDSIGSFAFEGCSELTNVVIPNTVRSIPYGVFRGCTGLLSIYIPSSISSIGTEAFGSCSGLVSIIVSSENSVYDSRGNCNAIIHTASNTLVAGCKNTVIPTTVTSIGSCAFVGCTNLTSITIPTSVTSFGSNAFYRCTGLTHFNIPSSVTSIGNYAFCSCKNLISVTIPNSVSTIGSGAFSGCTGLTSVNIPAGITNIYPSTFNECIKLSSITIPNSVVSIGSNAFYKCYSLTGGNCNPLSIPSSVETISTNAFYGVWNVSYGGSASGSPWGAISCNTYNEGYLSFKDASKTYLKACCPTAIGEIVIPNSVDTIGNYAFSMRKHITSVSIPAHLAYVGNRAFDSCIALNAVRFQGNVPDWCRITFVNGYSNPLHMAHNLYINNTLITSLRIPEGVDKIKKFSFSGATCFSSLTLPNTLTSIQYGAFARCEGLSGSLEIPDAVTSLDGYAFGSCKRISSLTLPRALDTIYFSAFNGCTGLSEIHCRNNVAPVLQNNVFDSVSNNIPIYVPCGSSYSYSTSWNDNFYRFVENDIRFAAYASDALKGYVDILAAPTCDDSYAKVNAVAHSGYRFDHWSDGETSNPRVFTVTEDIEIIAYFSPDGTQDIMNIAIDKINVYSHGNEIVIKGCDGENALVYDVMGRVIHSGATDGPIHVQAAGVYMVKVGNRPARKVVVR